MNRIILFIAVPVAIMLWIFLTSEHTEQALDGPLSREHTSSFHSKVVPFSKLNSEAPHLTKEDAAKTNTLLEARMFASPVIQSLLNNWKMEEKERARYISAKRSRGEKVIVLIPVVSSRRKDELRGSISKLLPGTFKGLTTAEYDSLKAALIKWIDFGTSDRVIQVDAYNNAESLSGRWLEVEDSSKIKDEFQYVDYGKITAHGFLSPDRLSDRYGHLFSIEEEVGAE